MKNTLGDLNNHLYAQLERLSEEEKKGDDLKEEIERTKAVVSVAGKIIDNGNLVLRARMFSDSKWDAGEDVPKMLEG